MSSTPRSVPLPPRVLVVGAPRSGTSWIAEGLSHGARSRYVREPDNERHAPMALSAKAGLGRFPVLSPLDDVPAYEALWERAFSGARPRPYGRDFLSRSILKLTPSHIREMSLANDHRAWPVRLAMSLAVTGRAPAPFDEPVVVKSVHCALALEWLATRFWPRVLVVVRNPLNVIASYLDLSMPDRDRRLDEHAGIDHRFLEALGVRPLHENASPLMRTAWQLALLMTAALKSARDHDWPIIVHDDACLRSREVLSAAAMRLGLSWGTEGDEYLRRSNRPGTGYSRNRIASQQSERWKASLDPSQVAEIRSVLAGFPLIGSAIGDGSVV